MSAITQLFVELGAYFAIVGIVGAVTWLQLRDEKRAARSSDVHLPRTAPARVSLAGLTDPTNPRLGLHL